MGIHLPSSTLFFPLNFSHFIKSIGTHFTFLPVVLNFYTYVYIVYKYNFATNIFHGALQCIEDIAFSFFNFLCILHSTYMHVTYKYVYKYKKKRFIICMAHKKELQRFDYLNSLEVQFIARFIVSLVFFCKSHGL